PAEHGDAGPGLQGQGHPQPAARQLRAGREHHERGHHLLHAGADLRGHLPGHAGAEPVHFPFAAGARLPGLRRRPADGQPAGHQHQPDHRPDLRHRRRPGRGGRRAAGHAVRRHQPAPGLPGRHQGLHRRRAGRHRQHSRRRARRPAAGRGRGARRRPVRRSIQGRGGLQPADPGAAVPSHRHSRASGGGKGMTRNLKTALFSTLLLLLVSYPILGLKLSVIGIGLQVEGADARTLWTIGLAAVALFTWQLLRDRLPGAGTLTAMAPSMPGQVKHWLTLPSTQRWIILALILVALAWPFFGSRAAVDIATLILIYVMLGLGLNIVVGLAGLLDLGYVGFYAVGAYTYALLAEYAGFGFWLSLPIAGLMAAFFGFILGFPVLRLRGDYLAIVTLGFGEIIRILLRNMTELTGGPNGISNIDKPTLFGLSFERRAAEGMQTFHEFFGIAYNSVNKVIFLYLIALLLVLLTLFVINRLLRMPLGRAWEALREDEIACRAL